MTQAQINTQYLRIAFAVTKAYDAVSTNLITETVFNSKLACAAQARNTLAMNQARLNSQGY